MASNSPSRALIVTSNNHSHSNDSVESPLRVDSSIGIVHDPQWQPILHASNQVVLYDPHSHALSITSSSSVVPATVVPHRRRQHNHLDTCPYCKQPLPADFLDNPLDEHDNWNDDHYEHGSPFTDDDDTEGEQERFADPAYESRVSNYFQLLAIANETSSITSSPGRRSATLDDGYARSPVEDTANNEGRPLAEGYFKSFFKEEYRLGMGASGSVYLCQHVLEGNPLGHFAVKKIAVGQSQSYLLNILREVRLLERLHHPNIITYHHAWLETSQFSTFGPKVQTLHVLMQWAEGGSLDDFIDVRLGRKPAHIHMHPAFPTAPFSYSNHPSPPSTSEELPDTPATPVGQREGKHAWFQDSPDSGPQRPAATHAPSSNEDQHSRSARIRAFRAYQRAPPEEKERMRREMEMFGGGDTSSPAAGKGEWTPVHLLSADEIKSLFSDVVEGLRFLHSKSILHLDLKPGNVLLTWDEGSLIPRAMLSDFGTSRDMIRSTSNRSGNTGTLEYTAPESLPSPQTGRLSQVDSKADMWSLGMILHKLLFFKLPYRYAAVGDANGEPISRTGEGEKMDRLEKEVLEYPGFKSTPSLVAGFETRRLPRSFLVLLENLLHKTPRDRPTCERVVTAIKEGKFDPLTTTSNSNLPIARTSSSSDPTGPNQTTPNLNDDSAPDAFISPENARLLVLPSPTEVLGSPEELETWRRWFTVQAWQRSWNVFWDNKTGMVRPVGGDIEGPSGRRRRHLSRRKNLPFWLLRGLRSCVLVAKVLTIPLVCPDSLLSRPRPVITGVLLAAAIADTIVDYDFDKRRTLLHQSSRNNNTQQRWKWNWQKDRGVWISLGLVLFHVGMLGLGRSQLMVGGWGDGDVDRTSTGWLWWRWSCCLPMIAKSTQVTF